MRITTCETFKRFRFYEFEATDIGVEGSFVVYSDGGTPYAPLLSTICSKHAPDTQELRDAIQARLDEYWFTPQVRKAPDLCRIITRDSCG